MNKFYELNFIIFVAVFYEIVAKKITTNIKINTIQNTRVADTHVELKIVRIICNILPSDDIMRNEHLREKSKKRLLTL